MKDEVGRLNLKALFRVGSGVAVLANTPGIFRCYIKQCQSCAGHGLIY